MTCVYFSYTIVAFVTCAAGIALALEHGCFKRPEAFHAPAALALALVLEGFSLRPESGLAAALMFAPFLVWALLRNRNVRTTLLALSVVALMGVSYLTGHLAYSITPGWESFDATFKAAQKVADYPHLAGDEALEAVPTMSDNDLSIIYEFLFADTSTYDLDTFTALDARVHGYGLFTLKTAVLSRKSFTAFVAGLVVIVAAIAAHLAYVLRLRGDARALMWSAPVILALEYLIVFLRARPNQASTRIEASTAAQAYVDENPEKIVMFARTQGLLTNADCLSFDRWQLPSNALFVGSYEQCTAPWQTFLTSNNLKLDGPFMNLLDGSHMVAVANADQAQMLATYLTEHSGSQVEAHMDESLGMGSGSIEYGVWSFSAA